ncbi:hypothetical protein [Frigoribacterium faeni]|uniref:Uncharacterized protein n=1 Tax=Frigoribacterium faeni TaxID=145483 RepID=A0A7W3JH11_9MICO|nr:hypothetical protein [Frigoribacterium faeni]MBA8812690.1 hypothetical protein [Frigoribacterium faeni]GEK82295.1 hypothetical protein FFA01_06040 [Frigoribacterium faeni]
MTVATTAHGLIGGRIATADVRAAAWCDNGCTQEADTASEAIALLPCLSSEHASRGNKLQNAVHALSKVIQSSSRDYLPGDLMADIGVDTSRHGYRIALAMQSVLQLAMHAAAGRITPESVATHLEYAAANLANAVTKGGKRTDAT